MKFNWLIVLILGLLVVLSMGSVFGVTTNEQQIVPDLAAAGSYLLKQMQRHRIKGMAVAITQGDDIHYLNGFGTARKGRPVTPTTPFYIGSVSKSFTALVVMQLVDQGLLDLDAPVQTYIPWFTKADGQSSASITVRHLLNQTSGLSNASFRRPTITEDTTLEESVRHLSQARLTAEPGTTFNYFNPNYNVLAQVVEEVTGTDFTSYLADKIFEPLDMQQSFADLPSAQQAGLADGYALFFGFPLKRQ